MVAATSFTSTTLSGSRGAGAGAAAVLWHRFIHRRRAGFRLLERGQRAPQHQAEQRDARDRAADREPADPRREHRAPVDLGSRAAHQRPVHRRLLARVGAEQGAVGDDVDDARHAVGQPVQLAHRAGREDFATCAGDAQAMADVGERLALAQRLQVVAPGDALGELAELRPGEHLAQLRLADQDDLQQLLRRGLEVGQQAHLLEHVGVEVLRLVHQQHDAPAAAVRVEQEMREQVNQRLYAAGRALRHLHVQLVADREQELGRGDARVQDQRHVAVRRQLPEQAAQHRRLAGSDLAGQLDEAAGLAEAVGEVGKGLRVPLAEVEIARVRRDRERLLVQPEETRIHVAGMMPPGAVTFKGDSHV